MDQVLKLVENYIVQRVMSNHAPLTHANKISMILPFLIGIMGLIGLVFCFTGFYIWLVTFMPLYSALSIMGGVFFVMALIFSMALIIFNRMKARKMRLARQQFLNDITLGVQLLENEISNIEFIQDNPKSSVSLAAILGYFAMTQMR